MIDAADNATHALPVTCTTRLRFVDASGNTFVVDLGQDLLGDWVLVQAWTNGALPPGGKRLVVSDHEAGLLMLQKIVQLKLRSGFRQALDYHVPLTRR